MKSKSSVLLMLLALILMAACATKKGPEPQIASSSEPPAPGEPQPESRAFKDHSVSPPRAASPRSEAMEESDSWGGSRDDFEPGHSRRRPGLATQWGEERDSRVYEVSFERQRPGSPASVISVHYDDEDGVEAATGRSSDDAYPRMFPVGGGALVVSITDDDGDPLPTLHANGRDYIVGDHGDRYQIQIKNHTAGRFEIVASVDGLDVLDGQEGSFRKRGYLVAPWGTLTIEGFRDSHNTVRAFRFGDVETSYAAQRGKARNVGVIGVAVFEERGFHLGYDDDEVYRRRHADPFPSRFAPAP